jgi:hypothetical protein
MGLLSALQQLGCSTGQVNLAIFFWHSADDVIVLHTRADDCGATRSAAIVRSDCNTLYFKSRELGKLDGQVFQKELT